MEDFNSLIESEYAFNPDDDTSSVDDHPSMVRQRHSLDTMFGGDRRSPGKPGKHQSTTLHYPNTDTLSNSRNAKSSNSMSYMSRLSSSFLSIASSVTDSYISATNRRRTSMFPNNSSSPCSIPTTDVIPKFVIPKWTTTPRTERLTSKAELMSFLKNSDPKGYHAAIVFDMNEEKLNSDEELYRKKIREEIAPIDFVEVSGLGQSERFCSIFEF